MKQNTIDNNTNQTAPASDRICKLGLDTHAHFIMVARQIEGQTPQPAQRFAVNKFVPWVTKQLEAGYKVFSCYEAGPTGFWLHRKLTKLGVTNYVVCPTRLDSRGKGVNTDKTDALELLVRLDRYVAGNRKAFSLGTCATGMWRAIAKPSRWRKCPVRSRSASEWSPGSGDSCDPSG